MPPPASSVRGKIALLVFVLAYSAGCFFFGCFAGRQILSRLGPPVAEPSVSTRTNAPTIAVSSTTDLSEEPATHSGSTGIAPGWEESQWRQIVSQPGSPARDNALAAALEKLAAIDPDRALALARAEGNSRLRQLLVQSALHGWARTAPTNAAAWALALPDLNERERAVATVFAGAVAADPNAAMHFGKFLIAEHPDDATGYGASLIEALGSAGNFEIAARLAADGNAQTRSGWMGSAYSRWAEFQPEQAAAAAVAITDPDLRNEALHGIVGGWAEADPAALVQFVSALPADTERGALLSQALERWAKLDPETASAWINRNDSSADLDPGIAAVATMDSLKPDLAIGWAESVTDPKLRSETLVTVIRNWLTVDLPAAKQYFESTKDLSSADRQELSEVFTNFSHDTAGR